MAARMRTHLGGPTHSFNALERMLAALVAQASAERGAVRARGHGIRSPRAPPPPPVPPAPAQPLPSPSQAPHSLQQQQQQQQQAGSGRRAAPAGSQGHPTPTPPPALPSGSAASASLAAESPTNDPDPHPTPALDAAWLALEFVGALERSVVHACEGVRARPVLPPPVLAFFAANRKVRAFGRRAAAQGLAGVLGVCKRVRYVVHARLCLRVDASLPVCLKVLELQLCSPVHCPVAEMCSSWSTRLGCGI